MLRKFLFNMKPTQLQFVKKALESYGEISRNLCLQERITRLGAIIHALRQEGWDFVTERRNGDYVYILKDKPKVRKTVVERDEFGSILKVKEIFV